ncbi:kunitz-type serine protease inhibitor taicotoxin [Plakobranchus ocellatus]|uniref:Kunitz-type serine protease inhibitor taicotoxin n=1 Tax=Plakobranchus ocellatus TaxID=259542 RepID=A0AAV4DTV9_9GAST|nr:kunitz-type serine protease inhibitor taicotoxin [Plakobranchus ocellatus]
MSAPTFILSKRWWLYLGIRCPGAVPPAHGYLLGEGDRVGIILYVRCEKGYALHGPTVMACMPKGEDAAHWSPDVTRECQEVDVDEAEEETEREEGDHEVSDSESEESPSPFLDHSMIKGGSDPPFLAPGSQYWETQRKQRENLQEEDGLLENREGQLDTVPAACRLTPLAGPCRAAFRRYFFDPVSMECHSFIYGGCHGNDNNFRTMEDCDRRCLNRH